MLQLILGRVTYRRVHEHQVLELVILRHLVNEITGIYNQLFR